MNHFSKKVLKSALSLLSINALIISSIASANTSIPQTFSYTAQGTTTVKTAKIFKQLMQNNSDLEIFTHVNAQETNIAKQNANSDHTYSYTVTGTTTRKTVKKLIELFQHNQQIEVIASSQTTPFNTVNTYKYQPYQPLYFHSNVWSSLYASPLYMNHNTAPFNNANYPLVVAFK